MESLVKEVFKFSAAILAISITTVIIINFVNIMLSLLSRLCQKAEIPQLLQHLGSGTIQADGSEQIVLDFAIDRPVKVSGWISLKNMEDGDTVILKEYHKLTIDGEPQLFTTKTVRGRQEQPLVLIAPKPSLKGVKITLQQTTGTYKYYPWEFFMELA